MLLSKLRIENGRMLTLDERLRAPKGGVSIKGEFYRGGLFIPSHVDQAAAKKAIEKAKAKQQEGSSGQKKEAEKETPSKKRELRTVKISSGNVSNKNFGKVKVSNNIDMKKFNNSIFEETDFSGLKIKNSSFNYCGFSGNSFENSSFENSSFEETLFKNVDFSKTKFKNCDFSSAFFDNCSLKGVDLSGMFGEKYEASDFIQKNDINISASGALWKGQPIEKVSPFNLGSKITKLKEKLSKAKIDTDVSSFEFIEKKLGAKRIEKMLAPFENEKNVDILIDDDGVSIQWGERRGENIAEILVNDDKSIGLEHLELKEKGKGTGFALLANTMHQCKKAGFNKFRILANISIGTYAWAKAGFDFEYKQELKDVKDDILDFLDESEDDDANGDITSSKYKELRKKVKNIKSAKDIAMLDDGKRYTKKEYLKKFGDSFNNRAKKDVPDNIKMHFGKAYMIFSMESWGAIKKL